MSALGQSLPRPRAHGGPRRRRSAGVTPVPPVDRAAGAHAGAHPPGQGGRDHGRRARLTRASRASGRIWRRCSAISSTTPASGRGQRCSVDGRRPRRTRRQRGRAGASPSPSTTMVRASPTSSAARIGKRGLRLDETKPGSGLGLSIVVDLAPVLPAARASSPRAPHGGLAVHLDLPAAEARRSLATHGSDSPHCGPVFRLECCTFAWLIALHCDSGRRRCRAQRCRTGSSGDDIMRHAHARRHRSAAASAGRLRTRGPDQGRHRPHRRRRRRRHHRQPGRQGLGQRARDRRRRRRRRHRRQRDRPLDGRAGPHAGAAGGVRRARARANRTARAAGATPTTAVMATSSRAGPTSAARAIAATIPTPSISTAARRRCAAPPAAIRTAPGATSAEPAPSRLRGEFQSCLTAAAPRRGTNGYASGAREACQHRRAPYSSPAAGLGWLNAAVDRLCDFGSRRHVGGDAATAGAANATASAPTAELCGLSRPARRDREPTARAG